LERNSLLKVDDISTYSKVSYSGSVYGISYPTSSYEVINGNI